MPLSWPLDLQLGSIQSVVVLALHQLDAASCAAAAPPLSLPHFWPSSTPGCTLLQQQQPLQRPADVPAHGSTCSGSGGAAQLRGAGAGEGAAMSTTVPEEEAASADKGEGSPAPESAAGNVGSPQPSGEAGPLSQQLPSSPEAVQQLEQEQQQLEPQQQQQEEEDKGGGPSSSSCTVPAAAAAPALDSFPPDLFPGQVLAAWVVDLNRLHPVGEDLAAAAVGPNNVVIEMEDGAYMYPPPAEVRQGGRGWVAKHWQEGRVACQSLGDKQASRGDQGCIERHQAAAKCLLCGSCGGQAAVSMLHTLTVLSMRSTAILLYCN